MASLEAAEQLVAELRTLAVEDPRRARERFCQLLDAAPPELERVLQKLGAPGEGRLRQLAANAVRARSEKTILLEHLKAWRAVETDEFAKRAIDGVLAESRSPAAVSAPRQSLVDPHLVEAYRYAAGRLRHQMRNAMMDPMAILVRLRNCVEGGGDAAFLGELASQLRSLGDALDRVGRIVELDLGDQHFELRPVELCPWVRSFNAEYSRAFRAIQLHIHTDTNDLVVRASDHLLHTIFWNLWINAQQAVGAGCEITVIASRVRQQAQLVVRDNGVGFSEDAADVAFADSKPRPGHRGRGLLEIQDAVDQLHGNASIIRVEDGSHRIAMCFPVEEP